MNKSKLIYRCERGYYRISDIGKRSYKLSPDNKYLKDSIDKTTLKESLNDIQVVRRLNLNNDDINISQYKDQKNLPYSSTLQVSERRIKNYKNGKIALKISDYNCEVDKNHKSFISASSNKKYPEVHHLIPL